jgi:hypothetical protein
VKQQIERWASILVGAGVVLLVVWITYAESEHHGKARIRASADGDAAATSAMTTTATATATVTATGTATTNYDLDGGFTIILGDASIALPSNAPRTVHIGIVLVQFQGAEGASNNARNKKDALAHAEELHTAAQADFKKAVRDGDSGSSEDIGRIPRGVLDPNTEVSVFSLGAGEISNVLETPKGYWIVKRLD